MPINHTQSFKIPSTALCTCVLLLCRHACVSKQRNIYTFFFFKFYSNFSQTVFSSQNSFLFLVQPLSLGQPFSPSHTDRPAHTQQGRKETTSTVNKDKTSLRLKSHFNVHLVLPSSQPVYHENALWSLHSPHWPVDYYGLCSLVVLQRWKCKSPLQRR